MLNKEKLQKAMEILGDVSEENKALLERATKENIPEKELFEKLGVSEEKFTEFMKASCDDKVLEQEVSLDELEAAAGGGFNARSHKVYQRDDDAENCVKSWRRNIYGGSGFANCAATVEDGSWCSENDACYDYSITYVGMKDCKKAWR